LIDTMAEYRRRRSTVKSLVDTFENKSGKRVTPSKIITSPRNDVRKSVPPPKPLQGAPENSGRRLMSEDEVSSLVHSALLRARLATSSFSPRARSIRSPLSQSSASPRGTGGTARSPSYAKRPTSSSTPRMSTLGLYVPEDEDVPGPSSLSRRSQRTMYATPKSRAGDSSVYSFDGFHSPEQGGLENVEVDINTFSTGSATFDEVGDTMTDEEDELEAPISSVNSSEAIIRRVEEEIANARRAAQEANRRLAGVSANLKDAKAAAMDGAAKIAVATESRIDSAAKKTSGESRNPSPSINPIFGEEDGSTQAMFDSAMDVIGEEFDIDGSKDDSTKLDSHNDHDEIFEEEDQEDPADPLLKKSTEEVKSLVTSPEPILDYLKVPADELVTVRNWDEQDVLEDEVPLSPSEEIDSLLRSSSNDVTEDMVVVGRQRTIDIASIDTILEDPLEVIKTTGNEGKIAGSQVPHPKKETLDRKAQKDEADLLAIASIDDEASIANEEIRASRDSAFDENMADDDLLEWLPIGSFVNHRKEKSHKFRDNEVSVDELKTGKDDQGGPSEASADDKEKEAAGNSNVYAGAIVTDKDIVAPKAVCDQELSDEGKAGITNVVDVCEDEQEPKSVDVIDHQTESQNDTGVAKFVEQKTPGNEIGLVPGSIIDSNSGPFAEKKTIESKVELTSNLFVENKGEESQVTRGLRPSVVEEATCGTAKDKGDPSTIKSKSGPFAETKTVESREDLSRYLFVENKGEDSQVTRGLRPSAVEEATCGTAKDKGDPVVPKLLEPNMCPRDTNPDVIIYQVVSVGSADATATARNPNSMDQSEDGVDVAQISLEPSFSKQEVIVDEAIEVVVEPFIFNADDHAEQVNRMNTSLSIESHIEESLEEESIEMRTGCQQKDEERPVDDWEADKAPIVENVPETSEGDKSLVQEDVIDRKIVDVKARGYSEVLQADLEVKPGENDAAEVVLVEEKDKDQEEDDRNNKTEEVIKDTYDHVKDNLSMDDDQVTQIMSNKEAERSSHYIRDDQSMQPMNTINEENSEDTDSTTYRSTKVEKNVSPPTEHQSSTNTPNLSSRAKPNSTYSPMLSHAPASQAPSPRQIALVENRRAVQAKQDQARNAMCGDSGGAPAGLPNPEKEIVHRVKRVKFKQRYPVPPQVKRPLRAAEIVFNNQTPAPKDKLHLSRPKKDLKELLEAAIGSSIQRRSNAFGALKVLSTQNMNKMTLVRTKGFLDSTVFAINENIASFEDTEAAVASRTRAVSAILNVAEMKDNRYHVLTHPGLANCLVKCIVEDKGEGRAIACSVLATIAKSQACREPMAKTHKLVDTLAIILKGDEPASFSSNEQNSIQEEKKDYSGDDEASRTVISNSFSSGTARSSVGSSHDTQTRNRARLSACAALVHLSKDCSVAQKMGTSTTLLHCVVATCNETENPLHTKCLEILANMTRFPHNDGVMTTFPGLVDTLITNGNHKNDNDRLWSMRTLQNLSSDPSSKTILATGTVLELLSVNIMRQKYDEQLAATAAVYNLSTEPGAVVPLTNTKNVVATLVHVAHNPTSSNDVRLMACDTLATLGLWLQTLAGAGTVPAGVDPVPLPTYITSGWKRWEK
jgi:hypothetical protein